MLVRDHHVLERYRYLIAAASIALLVMPRLPGIGAQDNGAFLAIKLGRDPVPAGRVRQARNHHLPRELPARDRRCAAAPAPAPASASRDSCFCSAIPALATLLLVLALDLGPAGSILLIVFVASLVAVLRERPSLKHFGPLLLVWGLAMLMLIFIRDLGSSLMFFGGFLALLYVATGRLSLVGRGGDHVPRRSLVLRRHRVARAGARRHLARPVLHRRGVCPSTARSRSS